MGDYLPYYKIVDLIIKLCKEETDFSSRIKKMIEEIGPITKEKIIYYLKHSGIIPEIFKHDSSEEKLYAKYCDFLVYGFFKLMDMNSRLCEERGDYADVIGKTKDYIIAAHSSVEKGHKIIFDYIGLKPLLDLDLRLGEGTGAALAMSIISAAIKILTQMATFEDAGVSKGTE